MRKLVGILVALAVVITLVAIAWSARPRARTAEPLTPSSFQAAVDGDEARSAPTLERVGARTEAAPTTRVSATDPRTSAIRGRVVGELGSASLVLAAVHEDAAHGPATAASPVSGDSRAQADTLALWQPDGTFLFDHLSEGRHTLTWTRSNSRASTRSEAPYVFALPHTLTVELGRDETKDVTIDLGPSAPCTIDVRILGREPAAAEAQVIALVTRADGTTGRAEFGTVDENGRRTGLVEGDVGLRLIVYDSRVVKPLCIDDELLQAIPGGRVSRDLTVALSSLVVELPKSLRDTDEDRVEFALTFPLLRGEVFEHDVQHRSRGRITEDLFQEGGAVQFLRLPASECEIEAMFPANPSSPVLVPGRPTEPRHPTFRTRVTLRPGAESRIVIP